MKFKKPVWKLEAEQEQLSIPNYWTFQEISRLLDIKSVSYLARLVRENVIYGYKIGKMFLVNDEQVQVLIVDILPRLKSGDSYR